MVIDSHQHFWHFNSSRDAWITDEMAALRRDFLPDELRPELTANHVDGCVAIQVDQSEQETAFLLDLARKNSFIFGVVGWVDLRSDCIADRLQYFSQLPLLRGFRHIAQAESDDRFLLRPDFVRGIGQLHGLGFTYDILIYARQLPAAIELVARFPEQKFVVDHIAKPEIKSHKIAPWERDIRKLASYPNVNCKLSGLVTEADWKLWRPADFKPYLDVVFDCFGTDRLMFGSDWPVCTLAAEYSRVKRLIEEYAESLPQPEKNNIFGKNAARFYGLTA
jgi:L-fuconolactonase